MGFLTRIGEKRVSPENPSTDLSNPASWLVDWAGGQPTAAGVTVNETNALRLTPVFACIRIIAETVAGLPLIVYKRQSTGKRRATEHKLYPILHDEPNEYMTSFVFRETVTGHLVSWGNGYSEIVTRNGRVTGLYPRTPNRTESVLTDSGTLGYIYREGRDMKPRAILAENMLHVPGLGFDGIKGYSPIGMARAAIGLGMALENFGSGLFGSGARVGGVLSHPARLKPDAANQLAESWKRMARDQNQHGVAVLEEGMTWTQTGIPPEEAQFILSRKMQVAEVARIYRMQLHKLQEMDRATFSNIEQQSIEHVVDTIRPYLVRWEQEINRKLFLQREKGKYFVEFLVDGLLRGDSEARYRAYSTAINWGIKTPNECRVQENMNTRPEGDLLLAPMNMVPMKDLESLAAAPEPGPPNQEPEPRTVHPGENRALTLRRRVQRANVRLVEDAARRLVKREAQLVRASIKKHLGERGLAAFRDWLVEFYFSHREHVERTFLPVLMAYAEQMGAVAAEEINAEIPDIEAYVRDYAKALSVRYTEKHRGQLEALADPEIEPEVVVESLETRLDEWVERTPAKMGDRETQQAGSFFSKVVWAAGGVTVLRWVTFGDTCPICTEMDGRTVGIQRAFLEKGAEVDPGGGLTPLKTSNSVSHPPLHQGCDCDIVPG